MDLKRVIVEPGLYRGSFAFRTLSFPGDAYWGPFSSSFGRVTCMLPADRYELLVSHGAGFQIEVKSNGTVDCSGAAGLSSSGATIQFILAPVQVDASHYTGLLRIEGVEPDYAVGSRERLLWKGMPSDGTGGAEAGYILALAPSNNFRFNVRKNGDVSLSPDYDGAATISGNKITLNTVAVRIDPCDYTGPWFITNAEPGGKPGARKVTLIPHARGYILELAPGVAERFNLLRDGIPSPASVSIPYAGKTWTFRLSKH